MVRINPEPDIIHPLGDIDLKSSILLNRGKVAKPTRAPDLNRYPPTLAAVDECPIRVDKFADHLGASGGHRERQCFALRRDQFSSRGCVIRRAVHHEGELIRTGGARHLERAVVGVRSRPRDGKRIPGGDIVSRLAGRLRGHFSCAGCFHRTQCHAAIKPHDLGFAGVLPIRRS